MCLYLPFILKTAKGILNKMSLAALVPSLNCWVLPVLFHKVCPLLPPDSCPSHLCCGLDHCYFMPRLLAFELQILLSQDSLPLPPITALPLECSVASSEKIFSCKGHCEFSLSDLLPHPFMDLWVFKRFISASKLRSLSSFMDAGPG